MNEEKHGCMPAPMGDGWMHGCMGEACLPLWGMYGWMNAWELNRTRALKNPITITIMITSTKEEE